MKKTLIAIALAAMVAPAWGAEVVSSNIVGYEKITVPVNKMDIVGVQFQGVGADGIMNLQDVTVDGYGEEGTDWIKIYNPVTYSYTTAYYYGPAMGGVYTDDSYETLLGPGWGDVDQIVVDVNLTTGQGVWTQAESGGKLVVSGEVTTNNTVIVPVNKMTLVSNPLPMTVDLQDVDVDGYGEEGTDWVKVYNPATYSYTTAYYYGTAMGGVYTDDSYETLLGPGWGDVDQIAVDVNILAGQGFWTQSETGGKLVFPAIPAN